MPDAGAPHRPDPAADPTPGLARRLPAEVYHELVRTLRLTLPPPPGDGPADRLRRDRAAIARIAALAPANAAEAELAAQFVAASEYWKECLRLAQLPETAAELAAKCRAQGLAMMRHANAALGLLLRLQDRRGKPETDNAGPRAQAPAGPPRATAAPAAEPPVPPPPERKRRPEQQPTPNAAAAPEPDRAGIGPPERPALVRRSGWLLETTSFVPDRHFARRPAATRTPAAAVS